MHINFNLRNKITKKNFNPLNLYLPTHENFSSPYTSPNLAPNLLSDWLWAYSSVGEGTPLFNTNIGHYFIMCVTLI